MAPTRVAGDLYFDIDGQLMEIKRQLRQKDGYPFDPMKLVKHLQAAIEGNFVDHHGRGLQNQDLNSSTSFKRNMRKEGWRLQKHAQRRIASITGLEPVSFLKNGEAFINGDELIRRAREELGLTIYSQEDAEFLLDHKEEIPEGFRQYDILFPGTEWRNRENARYMPCLRWRTTGRNGKGWRITYVWFSQAFRSTCRLIRSV